jgi:cytochrome c-type biogenesis protein CcmH/NrfG
VIRVRWNPFHSVGSKPGSSALRSESAYGRQKHGLALRTVPVLFPCILFLSAIPLGAFAQTQAEQHARQGLQFAQSGNLEAAELELRKAVALDPENSGYLADLGGILGMARKLPEAEVFFRKALRLDPGSLTIRRDLAANEWQKAREALIDVASHFDQPRYVLLAGEMAE